MNRNELINGFARLGELMVSLGKEESWGGLQTGITESEYDELVVLINKQFQYNGWFLKENVRQALVALGENLTVEKLENWLDPYKYTETPKRIGIIMAGNIPLVGFHDFLCVVFSGNIAVCKLSSDDKTLLPALVEKLLLFIPDVKSRIEFTLGRVSNMDAVIATGSDNSLKYFEQYFGKYPHVFRNNRTSIAILTGNETPDEMEALGEDIFKYFGKGCRNVSHLMVPEGYDFDNLTKGIYKQHNVINHFKYGNNYDYHKTVYLMNQHKLIDNNFVLLFENESLFSPLAMIYYHTYTSQEEIDEYIEKHKESIQVVVGSEYTPFGRAQCPALNDYADGIDVMLWLEKLI